MHRLSIAFLRQVVGAALANVLTLPNCLSSIPD
jgi:hypothetical protein